MNHQEAKDILSRIVSPESLSLIKVETFRLSWEGKGYNIIAEETGYDHDYVRKAGSQLWKELSDTMHCSVTKRNFRPLLEEKLAGEVKTPELTPEYPGAALSFSSPFYVERTQEEARTYSEMLRPGSIVRIKGPRKMGKSSLMLRVLDHADTEGYQSVVVDFMQADRAILSDLDTLLRWICLQVSAQLSLEPAIDDYWNEAIGSKLSCSVYLQDYILRQLQQPLVLVLNELNLIYDFEDVSRDFFPLLRSWHEEAKHHQQMRLLRLLLIYSTEIFVQLDMNLSPFNVGLPIELTPFNGDQLAKLSSVYGFNWKNDGTLNGPINQLLSELGGHPYLVQLALYELSRQGGFIDSPSEALQQLLARENQPGGIFSDFCQQILLDLSSHEKATNAFIKLTESQQAQISRTEIVQLERLGLIHLRTGRPVITSRLVASFLKKNVLNESA